MPLCKIKGTKKPFYKKVSQQAFFYIQTYMDLIRRNKKQNNSNQQRYDSETMEINLIMNQEKSHQNDHNSLEELSKTRMSGKNIDIFDKDFMVEEMIKPRQFLPNYQQGRQNGEVSCVESCNICCGDLCIAMAYGCAVTCCCKCAACVYQLETSKAGLVEQFGKFSRLLRPGINMVNPCSEEVTEVDLKIKIVSAGSGDYITKDNVKITVRSSIAYRITNPVTSHYVLGNNINRALAELTGSSFRNVIGQQILDEVLTNRIKIVGQTRSLVIKSIPPGISVERIFMEDIRIPKETIDDLSSAAKQRRISQANIISSQADVETAKLLKQSAQLLDSKAAMQIRYLQMVQQLGKKRCKLMMPIGIDKKGYKS